MDGIDCLRGSGDQDGLSTDQRLRYRVVLQNFSHIGLAPTAIQFDQDILRKRGELDPIFAVPFG